MRPARRLVVRRWRDPRLLLGVLLVLGSTVLGARLLTAHDDTVAVWALSGDVTAGDPVRQDQLRSTRVRLPSSASTHYLRVAEPLPARLADLTWTHDASGGALLDRALVQRRSGVATVQVPLSVGAGAFPADLSHGDTVDVWSGPGAGDGDDVEAQVVLHAARVESAGHDDALTGGSGRTVLVSVPTGQVGPDTIAALGSGHVTILRTSR